MDRIRAFRPPTTAELTAQRNAARKAVARAEAVVKDATTDLLDAREALRRSERELSDAMAEAAAVTGETHVDPIKAAQAAWGALQRVNA